MASLHQDPRAKSPYWYCAFCNSDGKRSFKSTKVLVKGKSAKETAAQRASAEEICRGWERAATQGQNGNLIEVQARRVLSDILERATGETLNVVTARAYLDQWAKSKELTKADGTAKRYRHTVDEFLKQLGVRADQNIAAVKATDISKFRDNQIEVGKSATTANMAVKTLRIPFNLARKHGIISFSPAEAVEMLHAESESRDVFTSAQLESILAVCDAEWKGLVLIARYCGLRLGDVVSLTWDNVVPDGDRFIFRFLPKKAMRGERSKIHEMPVHPKVEAYLFELKTNSRKSRTPLFPELSKLRLSGCNGLSARFQKIMEQAGVQGRVDNRERSGMGRSFHSLTFHSLRHTFVSSLANAGVAKEVRMKLSGHTSEVHQRYTHHELASLRSALELDK